MSQFDPLTPEEMIEYLTECTLATVEDLYCPKKLRIGEFRRQCTIAQKGIDFLGSMGVEVHGRLAEVKKSKMPVFDYYMEKRCTIKN